MSINKGQVLMRHDQTEKWIALHNTLIGSRRLAGLFRGWVPDGFDTCNPRVLYIGKATSGEFEGTDQEGRSFNGTGAFWDFARQIASACNCSDEGIPCIAWSNISKISGEGVTAEPSLLVGFDEEATESIESEIATIRPHIVVFVTNRFNERVVRKVSNGQEDSAWHKSETYSNRSEESNVWWKQRADGVQVLWMRHPQGALNVHRDYAAGKIAELAGIK